MESKGNGCIDKVHQEDQVNMDYQIIQVIILTNIIPLFLTILRRIMAIGGKTINPILHNTTVNKITLIKDNRRSSRRLNHKHTRKPHASHAGIRLDPWRDLATNGGNDEDELTRGRNSGLHQDERPTDDGQKG